MKNMQRSEKIHQKTCERNRRALSTETTHIPEEFTLPGMKKASKKLQHSAQKPSKTHQRTRNNYENKHENTSKQDDEKRTVLHSMLYRNTRFPGENEHFRKTQPPRGDKQNLKQTWKHMKQT